MPAPYSYETTEEFLRSSELGRQIIRIRENVSAALTAIGAKGVTVPSGSNSDDLADLIAEITGDLTTKTITLNGSYSAEDDSANGYSEVTVNVQGGASMTEVANTYGTELVITSAPGSAPSATRHTLYFEYEDETTETVYAYYDDSLIGSAITATTPTTHNNKTVTSAQLDGVEWYSYTPTPGPTPGGDWTSIYDGSITVSNREFSLTSITDTFTLNDVWRATLDGTAYTFTVQHADAYDTNYIGNIAIIADWASSGDPIVCYNIAGYIMGNTYLADGSHTLKLERQVSA